MSNPRKTPIQTYRKRLSENNMARIEVIAPKTDTALIRSIARRLAEKGPESEKLRESLRNQLEPASSLKGGLLKLLRDPAIAGDGLIVERGFTPPRKVEL